MIGNLNNVITKISIKVEKKGKAKIEKSKKKGKAGVARSWWAGS